MNKETLEGIESVSVLNDKGHSYDGEVSFGDGKVMGVSCVFWENYRSREKIIINQGGTYSGKTVAIMQLLILKCIMEECPKDNAVITIIGRSIPDLLQGAYKITNDLLKNHSFLESFIEYRNETRRVIIFKSGWQIEFNSYEEPQAAKQGKRKYCFFNEAQGVDWNIFLEIGMRTDVQIFLDYNPTAPFWVHENLIGTTPDTNELHASVRLIISYHKHNKFLSEEKHAQIENIKDPDRWLVYARGLCGNITGIIYPNWKMISDDLFPIDDGRMIFGIDYGYTSDPTALVKVIRVGESIYLHELCYETGLAAKTIKHILEKSGYKGHPIYSEHDPDMICQLRRGGLMVFGARKGQGSIFAGISKMKEFDVFYTRSSLNLEIERKRYVFINDPISGKPSNTPIDRYDHLLSAARYAVYTHYYKK